MLCVIRESELQSNPHSGSVKFDGGPHGAGVSFFIVRNEPGRGPDVHEHPYPETFIIHTGRALITAGTQVIEAGPGEIVVVASGQPHMFKNVGPGRLEVICIHANDRIVTEWL